MIYLDSNATTPIDPEVFDAMEPYLKEEYGNPSSKYYTKAESAKRAIEEAREKVALLIKAKPKEIVFTSGASESNNFIIKGIADYKKHIENKGNHIITSTAEHKSIIQTCKFLNGDVFMNTESRGLFSSKNPRVDRGYEVSFLDVNEYGQVHGEVLGDAIKENTILATIIWGNNELGSLNDISKLASICKDKNVLFHSDGTQVLGKIDIDVNNIPVDFLSFSAHKLYGPKGIGACYIRSGEYTMPKLTSLIHGGSQENGYRAGTHPVHNIVGFGKAAEIATRDMNEYIARISDLEVKVRRVLRDKFDDIEFLGDLDNHLPGTIGFILPSKHNELYIKRLADKIALSSGSACSVSEPSHVLKAINRKDDNIHFFRLSINKFLDEGLIAELENNL